VILHEDRAIPMVSYHQWFKVGSRHEKKGQTGIAHFFEHLMFKGSKNFPGETYDFFVTTNGGYHNAFTTRDYTGYFTLIPSDKLGEIIQIEADRLANLNFDQAQIASEREVVKEERRYRYDNSPDGTLYLLAQETVFKSGPYSWPVIGSMEDLNSTSLEQFQSFYRTYYSPNNAVVVVAGSFEPSEVKKQIEKAYSGILAQTVPTANSLAEPEQKSERTASKKMDVQNIKLTIVYRTVNAHSSETYPLSTMASLLGDGASSRLYKLLVRQKQLVTSVSVDQSSGHLEGTLSFDFELRPGVKVETILKEVEGEIYKLKNKLVPDAELQKVKNSVQLGYTRALKSVAGKARILAYSEITYGDPTQFFQDLDKYQAVSANDIQRVVEKYLKPIRRSVVTVVPKSI